MHKILFYNKFIISLYMFRALCAHHQEVKTRFYALSWLITKIILRCTVSKTSKPEAIQSKPSKPFICYI